MIQVLIILQFLTLQVCQLQKLIENQVYYISRNEVRLIDLDKLFSEDEEQYTLENVVSPRIYIQNKIEFLFSQYLVQQTPDIIQSFHKRSNYLGELYRFFYVLYKSNSIKIYRTQQQSLQFFYIGEINFTQDSEIECFDLSEITGKIIVLDCQKESNNTIQHIFIVVQWNQDSKADTSNISYNIATYEGNSIIRGSKRYVFTTYQEGDYRSYIISYCVFDDILYQNQDMQIEIYKYTSQKSQENRLELLDIINKQYLQIDRFQFKSLHLTNRYVFILDCNDVLYMFEIFEDKISEIYTYKFPTKNIKKIKGHYNIVDRNPRFLITAVSNEFLYEIDCTTLNNAFLIGRYLTKLNSTAEINFIAFSHIYTFLAVKEGYKEYSHSLIIYRKDLEIVSYKLPTSEIQFMAYDALTNRLMLISEQKISVYKISLPLLIINASNVKNFSETDISIIRINKDKNTEHVYQIAFLGEDYKSLIQKDTPNEHQIYSYSSIQGKFYNVINSRGNMAYSQLRNQLDFNFKFSITSNEMVNIQLNQYQNISLQEILGEGNKANNFLYISKGDSKSLISEKLFLAIQDKWNILKIIVCDQESIKSFFCKLINEINVKDQVFKMVLLTDVYIFNTQNNKQILYIVKIMEKNDISTSGITKNIQQSNCNDLDVFSTVKDNFIICNQKDRKKIQILIIDHNFKTQRLKTIENVYNNNKISFNPQSVSISSKFPSILFVKSSDEILLIEISQSKDRKIAKLIQNFTCELIRNDLEYKIAIKHRRIIIFSKKFQRIEEYKILSPYEIIKVRTFHNHQFDLIRINFEDSSSRSKFMSILGKKGENQSILIMKTDCASYHNLKEIIPLQVEENLKNIQIIPFHVDYDLLILYTNFRLQIINLYFDVILQYEHVSQPKSNYFEQFFIKIETRSQLYPEIIPTNQILKINLWNSHQNIESVNNSIELKLIRKIDNKRFYIAVEDQKINGQTPILNRILKCTIAKECGIYRSYINDERIIIGIQDKLHISNQGFQRSKYQKIIQMLATSSNKFFLITQDYIYVINSQNINQILKEKYISKLDNYQNYLFSIDEDLNNIAILKQYSHKYLLEIYFFTEQLNDIIFQKSLRVTLHQPQKIIILKNLIFIFEKYLTSPSVYYSCLHIYYIDTSESQTLSFIFLFDNQNLGNRYKGIVNDFFVVFDNQSQNYILFIADSEMQIWLFQFQLNQKLQIIDISHKYTINFKIKKFEQYISYSTEIVKLFIQTYDKIHLITILTKDSNHLQVQINAESGEIGNLTNIFMRYGNCQTSSESQISSKFIVVWCQNDQDTWQRVLDKQLLYKIGKNQINHWPNVNYVSGQIPNLKFFFDSKIIFTLSPTQNKIWIAAKLPIHSILELSYQDELLIVINGEKNMINSKEIDITYRNDFSQFTQRVTFWIDGNSTQNTIKVDNNQELFFLTLSSLFIIFILWIWIILLEKYCMKENQH